MEHETLDTVEIPEYLLERLDKRIDALQRTYDSTSEYASIRLLDKVIKAVVRANEDIYTYAPITWQRKKRE